MFTNNNKLCFFTNYILITNNTDIFNFKILRLSIITERNIFINIIKKYLSPKGFFCKFNFQIL